MKLAWGNSVSPEFRDRVLAIAKGFGWKDEHASWLMACMHFESGGTFSPSVKNMAGSGATGLIQFMPKTAIGLGTTVDDLSIMTAVEQLDYVAKYFKPYAKRVNSLADMYMAILLPSAVGKPDDVPLFSGGVAYRQNAALDADRDGIVTKAEAAARVAASLRNGLNDQNAFLMQDQPKGETMAPFIAAAIPALIQALPDFAKIFKSQDVAERNVEAVTKAATIVMEAVGASNVQEAVEKVQSDPAIAQIANQAVRMSTADLVDIMERINAMDQGNIKAAREYNTQEPLIVDTRHVKLKFWNVIAVVVILSALGAIGYVLVTSTNAAERTMALQVLLLGGFGVVMQFIFGSSNGSDKKTDLITRGNTDGL